MTAARRSQGLRFAFASALPAALAALLATLLAAARPAPLPVPPSTRLSASAPTPAQDPDDPEVVARLELLAPTQSPFLLHGTFPVPKGVFPREDGKSPFAVLSHGPDGGVIPAQTEIVSRYPTGEADVVEIFARVALGPAEKPGARVGYSVILSQSQPAAAPRVPKRVDDLLARRKPGRFGLRTRDVYGNAYWAELSGSPDHESAGSTKILKSGPWVRQRRVYATMTPTKRDAPAAEDEGDDQEPQGGATEGGGPLAGSGPPLPHFFGVHAYITETAGSDAVALDLRVNNGATSGSAPPTPIESTLGIVYWRNLQLVLPAGWTAISQVSDPFLGNQFAEGASQIVTLVKPYPDGRLHMMGPQGQLERRLVLVPTPKQAPKGKRVEPQGPRVDASVFDPGLAFSVAGTDLWSWYEPSTARYFPQRDLLGNLDFVKGRGKGQTGKTAIRARLANELALVRSGLETGTAKGWYVTSPAMGWAHPWWVKEQGSPGGEGISTFEGYYAAAATAREGIEYLSLIHRMNVCRQPQAAYNAKGDVVGYHAWLDAQGKVPFDFRLNGGVLMPPFLLPCMRGPAASDQVREVVKRGLRPPYDLGNPYEAGGAWPDRSDCLFAWWPHDDQHYVRWTKQPKALVWLTNDALSKDDLILAAELYHLHRHESPHVPASWSGGVTLKVFEGVVQQFPHQGIGLGREDAWGIDAMCAAYSVASPDWRKANFPWFQRMGQLIVDAAMPTGIVQRFVNNQLMGHERYTATQTFESLFLIHAMRCINESVLREVDDERRKALEDVALRGVDYLFFGLPWARIQNSWQPYPSRPSIFLQGPRQGIAVGLNDNFATLPFCYAEKWGPNYMPPDGLRLGVEWFHPWAALSYAHQITDGGKDGPGLRNKYLRRAIDCGKAHKTFKDLVADFAEQASDPTYDNSPNWIGLLGKIQALQRKL